MLPALALAQAAGGTFVIRKQAIGGGAQVTGGSYRLTGTVVEAARGVASGGAFRVTGGLHTPGVAPDTLLCDGFEDTPCP
jgi:hypothetical protein